MCHGRLYPTVRARVGFRHGGARPAVAQCGERAVQDVIAKMVSVENEAKRLVAEAEAEAKRLAQTAGQQAERERGQALEAARAQARELIETARREAEQEKSSILARGARRRPGWCSCRRSASKRPPRSSSRRRSARSEAVFGVWKMKNEKAISNIQYT